MLVAVVVLATIWYTYALLLFVIVRHISRANIQFTKCIKKWVKVESVCHFRQFHLNDCDASSSSSSSTMWCYWTRVRVSLLLFSLSFAWHALDTRKYRSYALCEPRPLHTKTLVLLTNRKTIPSCSRTSHDLSDSHLLPPLFWRSHSYSIAHTKFINFRRDNRIYLSPLAHTHNTKRILWVRRTHFWHMFFASFILFENWWMSVQYMRHQVAFILTELCEESNKP